MKNFLVGLIAMAILLGVTFGWAMALLWASQNGIWILVAILWLPIVALLGVCFAGIGKALRTIWREDR